MSVRSCFLWLLRNAVKLAGRGEASTGWGGGAGDGALQIQPINQPLALGVQRRLVWPRGFARERARRACGLPAIAQCLDLCRDGQHVPQPLVLHDRALIDLGQPVIGGVGQGSTIGPQFDPAIRILGHLDVAVDQAAVLGPVLEQVHHLVVLQRQALRHLAPFAPGKDACQILVNTQRPVGIEVAARRLGEAGIEVGHEGRRKGIGDLHGAEGRAAAVP